MIFKKKNLENRKKKRSKFSSYIAVKTATAEDASIEKLIFLQQDPREISNSMNFSLSNLYSPFHLLSR